MQHCKLPHPPFPKEFSQCIFSQSISWSPSTLTNLLVGHPIQIQLGNSTAWLMSSIHKEQAVLLWQRKLSSSLLDGTTCSSSLCYVHLQHGKLASRLSQLTASRHRRMVSKPGGIPGSVSQLYMDLLASKFNNKLDSFVSVTIVLAFLCQVPVHLKGISLHWMWYLL